MTDQRRSELAMLSDAGVDGVFHGALFTMLFVQTDEESQAGKNWT